MGRRGAFIAVALLCGLVACDDEPTPNIPDPTPSSTSPSVTESVSPTTPTETPEALTPEETVRAWIKAQNNALRSGDTDPLRILAAEGCQGCADYPDGIDAVIEAGGSFDGGLWTLVTAKVAERDTDSVRLNVAVRIGAGVTVTEAGAEPNTYEADSRLMTFEMVRVDAVWLISLIAFVS